MTPSPEVTFGVALLALVGVFFTALVALLNARKRADVDRQLLELKANLDKLNSLELAKVQAEHSRKLKDFEQERMSQSAADERRRSADAKTLKNILSLLAPDMTIAFFRKHDFGGTFDRQDVSPLRKFLELSEQPDSEFLENELEQLRERLVTAGTQLSGLLATKTYPRHGTFNSVLPENMINESRPTWVTDNAKAINDCATEFCEIYDKLIRHARKAHGG